MSDGWRSQSNPLGQRYRTVADYAYAQLRERIVRGELPPGERIDQDAEAKLLDVSRMPIREALRRLATEGLVDLVPHRGAQVRMLSADDLIDLYILRDALEGLASRLGTPRLSEGDVCTMRSLIPAMEDIVESGNSERWFEVDWQFHSVLYAASGRSRLVRYIWMLWEDASRYRHLRLRMPNELRASLEGHYRILAACERRDTEEVERLITEILVDSQNKLLRAIEEDGDPTDDPNHTTEQEKETP